MPAVKDGRAHPARRCPMSARPARRASSSTLRRESSRTRACARRSASPSISSGRTRTCSSVSTRAPQSFFENSDMKAAGPPSPEELQAAGALRDKLSPEVFGEPYAPPVTDGSGNNRDNLRKAAKLLHDAGYGPGGKPLDVEILSFRVGLRPHHPALRREPEAHRHQRLAPPRRPGAIRAPPEVVRLRHDHPALFAAADARRRAQELLGHRRPPAWTAASISPASRTPSSTR